jgi:hypothetical protein
VRTARRFGTGTNKSPLASPIKDVDESPRKTKLCDRTGYEITLDDVERISIRWRVRLSSMAGLPIVLYQRRIGVAYRASEQQSR